jgi:hypothetical protein
MFFQFLGALPWFHIFPRLPGMTIFRFTSYYYNMCHTREGGYPGAKMTFYDFITLKFALILKTKNTDFLNCKYGYILPGFTDLKILKGLWQVVRKKKGGVIKKFC